MNTIKNFLLILALLFLSPNLFAESRESARMTASRTYTARITSAPGKTLFVDKMQAEIEVLGAAANEITAEAVVEVSDLDAKTMEEFFAKLRFVLEPYRDGFRLSLDLPTETARGKSGPPSRAAGKVIRLRSPRSR